MIGMLARFCAATAVAPAELLRVRAMAMNQTKCSVQLATQLGRDYRNAGVAALFRGHAATLLRDVPFAGLYWSAFEALRDEDGHESASLTFIDSFQNGAMASSFTVACTHPFDFIKTRVMMEIQNAVSWRWTWMILVR